MAKRFHERLTVDGRVLVRAPVKDQRVLSMNAESELSRQARLANAGLPS